MSSSGDAVRAVRRRTSRKAGWIAGLDSRSSGSSSRGSRRRARAHISRTAPDGDVRAGGRTEPAVGLRKEEGQGQYRRPGAGGVCV